MNLTNAPSPVHELLHDAFEAAGVRVLMKRDDLLDPEIPGNKFRKLKYNLQEIERLGKPLVLTLGGAYSNHIYAVAAAGRRYGFRTIGVIRGEAHEPLNPVLSFAVRSGMELSYLDREAYRRKDSSAVLSELRTRHGDFYLLPEGGTNCLAIRGCAEIVAELEDPFDYICCASGTGGTLAGIATGLCGSAATAIGFSVLKGGQFLVRDVEDLLRECAIDCRGRWIIETEYHFGGFAKTRPELVAFVDSFYAAYQIRLDVTYVGKMMFGLFELVRSGWYPRGSTIVAVHTGGGPVLGAHSSGSL